MAAPDQRLQYYKRFLDFPEEPVQYIDMRGPCYGVAVHDNGTVYAGDENANTIKVFKPPNGVNNQIGSPKIDGGQLSNPRGIALIDDTIYVVSSGNHTVKTYSTDGTFTGGFGTDDLETPRGICTDKKGRVLVADRGNNRIQRFTIQKIEGRVTGEFQQTIHCDASPYDVAVDPKGNIHAALYDNNHIAIYLEDGNLINTYNLGGELLFPKAIHIDHEGYRIIGGGKLSPDDMNDKDRIWIANSENTPILPKSRLVRVLSSVTTDRNGIIYTTDWKDNDVGRYVDYNV